MPGSLREKRKDVWELRIYVGRDAEGKIRHVQRTFNGTRKAAEKELARLQVAAEDGFVEEPRPVPASPLVDRSAKDEPAEPVRVHRGRTRPVKGTVAPITPMKVTWGPHTTINDAITAWKANGWADLSPATTRRYQNNWDVHIHDTIGKRTLVELGPYDVEQFLRSLKARGMAESSVRQVRAILHRACRLARKWSNNTLPNPVADTEMPGWTLDERRPEVRAPSAAEVRALIDKAMELDLRFGVFLRVVAAIGARRGEVAALRWEDIDVDAGTVSIDESIVADKGGARNKAPKTRKSIRRVAVDAGTIEAIGQLRADRDELAAAVGVALEPRCFVFASDPDGVAPPHPDFFSHAFERARLGAGVSKDVHLHSLRHFQSTELDAVISEAQKQARMGWATVKMARHYTDAVTAEDRKAADHIGALLAE
jgi:integrase